MTVEDAILELTAAREPGKTICPSEAARLIGGDGWRARMGEVRAVAVRLAQAGRIVITRKGKPVNPADFKGVYRLRRPLPNEDVSGVEEP
jgi:hypothetical protein